ncbi:hypothetical protein [Natronorubrum halophilum]|uniref:hypothetical protein n=1 Tax=Natronorubrum halophilum TaxID=1702106 RepID=UPI0010C1B631|nr:hypothetical protein [Natronorubrum halophilum]
MGENDPSARPPERASRLGGAIAERTWSGAIAVLVLAGTVAALNGPIGALAGLVVAATWYGFGTPYAIAAAAVLLVGLFPDGIDGFSFALVATAMVLLVLTAAARTRRRIRTGIVALVSIAVLGGVGWGTLETWPLWIAVSVTLVVFALLSYGLHRYELVALGLVSDDRSSGVRSDGEHADRSADRTGGGEPT